MLGQYKKIAIWTGNDYHNPDYHVTYKIEKNMNCNFEIKKFIVFLRGNDGNRGCQPFGFDSEDYVNFNNISLDNYANFACKFYVKDRTKAVLELKGDSYVKQFYVTKIIAIG